MLSETSTAGDLDQPATSGSAVRNRDVSRDHTLGAVDSK